MGVSGLGTRASFASPAQDAPWAETALPRVKAVRRLLSCNPPENLGKRGMRGGACSL